MAVSISFCQKILNHTKTLKRENAKQYPKQDSDGQRLTLMFNCIFVGVKPGVKVMQLRLHVQLLVLHSVLGRRPVQVDKSKGVVAALNIHEQN
jgi:hypothetical protein